MIPAIVVSATAVACLLAIEWSGSTDWAGSKLVRAVAKMSAASAFLAMALACGALESTYGRLLTVALVSCWIGDACLLSSGRSRIFLAGIGAFLVGHLVFAAAFYQLGVAGPALLIAGIVMGGLAAIALRWLWPHIPADFRLPVFCYIGVISLMVAVSIGTFVHGAPLLLAIGAVGFAVSDLFVARERFVSGSFFNSALGLPLYFGSQMLLASTARFALG